jgi:lipoprotein-releasing system permease protein
LRLLLTYQFKGLISSTTDSKGVAITGIDIDAENNMSIIPEFMISGSVDSLKEKNSIIIGSWLASSLGVFVGDSISITTF